MVVVEKSAPSPPAPRVGAIVAGAAIGTIVAAASGGHHHPVRHHHPPHHGRHHHRRHWVIFLNIEEFTSPTQDQSNDITTDSKNDMKEQTLKLMYGQKYG